MTGIANLPLIVSHFPTAMPREEKAYGDMEQKTWGDLRDMVFHRREGQKDGPNLVFARLKIEAITPQQGKPPKQVVRRLKINVEARTAVALDIEANKKTGEVPPALVDISDRLILCGWAALLYTSHNHTPRAPRYRIVVPLTAEIPPHLPAVEAIADMLGLSGVLDGSKLGASSVFYLPSCERGAQENHYCGEIEGDAIDADWIVGQSQAILDERDRKQAEIRAAALAESERRRAAKAAAGFKPADKLIDGIRDRLDLAGELIKHGYQKVGDRYLYPGSETGIPGVHILRGADGVERVFSHHSGDPLAAGNLPSWCTVKAVDAVDVVAILDFGGDQRRALHELGKRFGIKTDPLHPARQALPDPPPGFDNVPWPDEPAHGLDNRFDDAFNRAGAGETLTRPVTLDRDADGFVVSMNGQPINEDGLALAFAAAHADRLRFDHTRGKWMVWTGKAWRQDEVKIGFGWARRTCREIAKQEGAKGSLLSMMAKAATAAAVERFAQADPDLRVTSAIWDNDPFLLGTPAGTVDLRTGNLRDPVPEDHITKLTAVAPADTADCPRWLTFLKEVTKDDAKTISFLKQWFGYCLTGDTREHALLFAHGPGGNGKGVLLNTVAKIMGEYAINAAMDTFVASAGVQHPTDLAMLRGARLVTASETEEGRAWAEARIKALTGGDRITARFMRRDFFQYDPEFKLTIIGNHKPVLKNVDDAARRRFNVVPFTHKPEKVDRQLEVTLKAEWPGILRWMIDGCLDWQRDGLVRPDVVANATREYFSEQDTVHQWVDDCCTLGGDKSETVAVLFKSWTDYALANGEKPGTSKWFSDTLVRLGCSREKNTPGHHGKRGFSGIEVTPPPAPKSHHEPADDGNGDDNPPF